MAADQTLSSGKNSLWRSFLNSKKILGKNKFVKKSIQWQEVLKHFKKECVYCCKKDSKKENLQVEHLIPTNKEFLGFNHIGNIAPCCESCNNSKHRNCIWQDKLKIALDLRRLNKKEFENKKKLINKWMSQNHYSILVEINKNNLVQINNLKEKLDTQIIKSFNDFENLFLPK